jgi:gluconokinase
VIAVVMGVSGAGKTTVGEALARELGCRFLDADDYHPPENVAKMAAGQALDDQDRGPWLDRLNRELWQCDARDASVVLACSALKESYRELLLIDERVALVYLKGDYELIRERLDGRDGHFMKASMLDSQFAALEEPGRALTVDASSTPAEIVRTVRDSLGV